MFIRAFMVDVYKRQEGALFLILSLPGSAAQTGIISASSAAVTIAARKNFMFLTPSAARR